MAGLAVDDGLALGPVLGVAGGEGDLAPVHPADLGLRRVPRMVGVGEAHPAEPVLVSIERVEPGDDSVSHPIGVVDPTLDRVHLDLGCPGVAATFGVDLEAVIDGPVEHAQGLRVVLDQPLGVVERTHRPMRCRLEVLEAPT